LSDLTRLAASANLEIKAFAEGLREVAQKPNKNHCGESAASDEGG